MKSLMLIASTLFAVNAFAGLLPGEKWDFTTAVNPIGASLGNVCYNAGLLKVINPGSSCARYTEKEVQEEDGKVVIERSCAAWTKNLPKSVKMLKRVCLESTSKWVDRGESKGLQLVSKCIKTGTKAFPRSQRLDVYVGEGSEKQNMGSAMYTIPDCSEL